MQSGELNQQVFFYFFLSSSSHHKYTLRVMNYKQLVYGIENNNQD
jgi:hypothetical protein